MCPASAAASTVTVRSNLPSPEVDPQPALLPVRPLTPGNATRSDASDDAVTTIGPFRPSAPPPAGAEAEERNRAGRRRRRAWWRVTDGVLGTHRADGVSGTHRPRAGTAAEVMLPTDRRTWKDRRTLLRPRLSWPSPTDVAHGRGYVQYRATRRRCQRRRVSGRTKNADQRSFARSRLSAQSHARSTGSRGGRDC